MANCGCEIYEVCMTCNPETYTRLINSEPYRCIRTQETTHVARPPLPCAPAKCDGNHAGPPCGDPQCWNDIPPLKHRTRTEPHYESMNADITGVMDQIPERSGREDDQPLPVKNDLPAIQDLVQKDIEERKKVGLKRYGTLLQANNGRDFLLDAYQEAMDLTMYLRGLLYERDGK